MSGRVLHFGKYEGCEIQRVVDIDPAYILWAIENVKGHGINQKAAADARSALDTNEDEDFDADLADLYNHDGYHDSVGDR